MQAKNYCHIKFSVKPLVEVMNVMKINQYQIYTRI
jgi:hypothetical protein